MNRTRTLARLVAALAVIALALTLTAPAEAARNHPRGKADDWTYVYGAAADSPAWDPCSTITWSAPQGLLARGMRRAVRMAAKFSGLTFRRVASAGQITAHWERMDDAIGLAALNYRPAAGLEWMVSAELLFHPTLIEPGHPRFTRAIVYPVVMHELGHALGLGHARRKEQIMHPTSGDWNRYGWGDRTGLAAVQRRSCQPPVAPPPAPSCKTKPCPPGAARRLEVSE